MCSQVSIKKNQYEEIIEGENFLKQYEIDFSNVFSIPFGGNDSYNQETLDILNELRYSACLLSSGSLTNNVFINNSILNFNELITINRIMPRNEIQTEL